MKMKKILCSLFTLIIIASLTGCANGKSYDNYNKYDNGTYYDESAKSMDYASEEAGDNGIDNVGSIDNSYFENQGRKLITTVDISVETKTFDEMMNLIEEKIKELGGYFEKKEVRGEGSEYSYNSSSYKSANLTLRIPSKNLSDFVILLDEKANVVYKLENTSDITLEYKDTESRKKTLEIEQERLWKLLEQADSVDTIIGLESRLSEVRYELEKYNSDLRGMDNKIEYSTLYINLTEVKEFTPDAKKTIGERINVGLRTTLGTMYDLAVDSFVYLVILSPVLILIAFIVLIFVFFIRFIIYLDKKKMKKRAEAMKTEVRNTNANKELTENKTIDK